LQFRHVNVGERKRRNDIPHQLTNT
jgi:hypothetical protein